MKTKLKHLDYWLLVPFLLLVATGIVMVYSASSNVAVTQGLNNLVYLRRQVLFVLCGLILGGLAYLLKLDKLKSTKLIAGLLLLVVLLLLFLLVRRHFDPSSEINGASSWIKIGPINMQPLELAKLILILYLAKIYSQRWFNFSQQGLRKFWHELWPPIIVAILIIFLTALQPDLGGAAILATVLVLMSFASGIDLKYVIVIGISLIALFTSVYFYFQKESLTLGHSSYQLRRLMAFYHPFELEKSGGSQLVNSYYAINNGGLWGRGLGNSIQKLGYLPEPHTDFILAIIAEELGVIGVIIILTALFFLIARIVYLGVLAPTVYLSLLSYGIAGVIFIQSFFNIGGMLGILPITGVTLPFISYGGSSIIILSICMGIMLNVSINLRQSGKETT
ncbi:FtsW/RodA/SpoVE family cell cycle protein [Lactobacillus sp. DCY120]|uniref:Probable peptidoglycan glycosyltransferase FtsW n=1 Tax=Bombilactobacillus apium TaxID=2675299 RepID=A0A850QYC1_9LACO|nr:FtsW/RodA/SpoVE family cell cycle protein [Bombilactobacillus apium]NVY95709.1 FtsW/RodA/SpoVE family cell cycle protein [Bombilactobacillus apium]